MLTILTLTLISISVSNAQFHQAPPPCLPKYTAPTYEFAYQIISPPLYPSTPFDVMLGYVALDSVCHFAPRNQVRSFIENLSYDDTLKMIMKYWYKIADYDAFNYLSYTSNTDSSFRSSPGNIIGMLQTKIYTVSPYKIEDLFLCQSVYIYKGVVTDSIVGIDSLSGPYKDVSTLYTVIIDTLKGNHFPSHLCSVNGKLKDADDENKLQATIPPQQCLALDFRPAIAYQAVALLGIDTLSALPPKVGDTCYFFVRPGYVAYCPNSSFIAIIPSEGTKSGGVYRVVNGLIKCPDLEFTGKLIATEDEFRSAVLDHIARITLE